MRVLRFQHFTIRLYTDPVEYFTKEELLDIEIHGVQEFTPEYNCGHVKHTDNIIRFLFHPESTIEQVMRVVAHELGHKIEGGYKKNPPDKLRYFKRHEAKAEHYEYFGVNALKLTQKIMTHL